VRSITGPYVLSCLANGSWIVLWHYEWFGSSLLVMGVLLGSRIVVYRRLDIGRAPVTGGLRWAVHAPFSVYLGWVTVATIANVASVLWLAGWGGFGLSPEVWTVVMLVAATAIATAVALTRSDVLLLLVLVWAFAGIDAKHPDPGPVSNSAAGAAAIVGGLALWSVVRRRRSDTL